MKDLLKILRASDIRLVLFTAGALLCVLSGNPWNVLDEFQKTMSDKDIIAPICSAMGFAFVLRAVGADRQMVRLLIRPIRRVPWLLLPGGCAIGFVANMAITSQTGAAAAVGPVLVPLMLAAGYSPVIAAATLVLGCSGGGNLFNPAEPDIVNIVAAASTGTQKLKATQAIGTIMLPELIGFAAAVLTMWGWHLFGRKSANAADEPVPQPGHQPDDEEVPVNYLKALLPPLPILLLLLTQAFGRDILPAQYSAGLPVPHAMIISAIVVMMVHFRDFTAQTRSFFEGLGYAYVHVISLIIAASCFIAGLKAVGAIERLVKAVGDTGVAGQIAALFFPMALGVLSGSGTAPSVGFSKTVLPSLAALNVQHALDMGALGAIGATFGRTMSPVAAVVIFATTLSDATPLQIIKKTGPALITGALAALITMIVTR